jgi:sugar/nucleoside kinase (ribokinase family)
MILSVGELLVDLITTEAVSDLSQAGRMSVKAGGSPANFASFCSRLGARVNLVSAVGHDGLGRLLLDHVSELGLCTDHIQQVPQYATSVIIIGASHETPEFIPYRDADCHIHYIHPDLIAQCDLIHTTAFALSKMPAQGTILDALEKAHSLGKRISVDWNYTSKIWGLYNHAWDVFERIMRYHPLLKLSEDDIARFWGQAVSIEEVKLLLNRYPETLICITCGADGVWYRGEKENEWRHKTAPPVNITDATGAGDSFWSGFVTSYLQNQSIDDCIDKALETARLKLTNRL